MFGRKKDAPGRTKPADLRRPNPSVVGTVSNGTTKSFEDEFLVGVVAANEHIRNIEKATEEALGAKPDPLPPPSVNQQSPTG